MPSLGKSLRMRSYTVRAVSERFPGQAVDPYASRPDEVQKRGGEGTVKVETAFRLTKS